MHYTSVREYTFLTSVALVLTLVTWQCVEKRTLAKGSDRPSSSAAINPRPWYRWHRSWKYLLSAETKDGLLHLSPTKASRLTSQNKSNYCAFTPNSGCSNKRQEVKISFLGGVRWHTLAGQTDRKLPLPCGDQPPLFLILFLIDWNKLLWQAVNGFFTVFGQTQPEVDLQLRKDLTCWTSRRLKGRMLEAWC